MMEKNSLNKEQNRSDESALERSDNYLREDVSQKKFNADEIPG